MYDRKQQELYLERSKENLKSLEAILEKKYTEAKEYILEDTQEIQLLIQECEEKIKVLMDKQTRLLAEKQENLGVRVLQSTISACNEDIRAMDTLKKQNEWADILEEKLNGKEQKVYFVMLSKDTVYRSPSQTYDTFFSFVRGRATKELQVGERKLYVIPEISDIRTSLQNSCINNEVIHSATKKNDSILEYISTEVTEEEKISFVMQQISLGKDISEISKVFSFAKLDIPLKTIINLGSYSSSHHSQDTYGRVWLYK